MAMAEESRLIISVDARNAEKTAKALSEELNKLKKAGDNAAQGVENLGAESANQNTKLSQFKTSVTALSAELATYSAGIAGAVTGSVGALALLAVQTANTAAEIERFAYLSGTTTTEFQEWAVGARAMGIEMDKLSDIFKDVQDRVGDFITTGGGELADFFTEIAVKTEAGSEGALKLAKSMRELSGADALQLYVSKLQEAGVSQSEMIFFMESMADEATALIPLLENGGEGFRLWAEAARNAGAIMDEETLEAAQRLKVETMLLEMQMTGLKNQFMQAVIPALNQIAGAFLTSSEQGVQFNSVAETVAQTMIWLAKVGTGVAATFDIVGKTIGGAAAAMADEGVTHQMVLDDLSKTVDLWGTRLNKLNEDKPNNKLINSLVQVQQRANESANATAKTAINTTKMQETFDKAAKSAGSAAANTEKLKREAEQAAKEAERIMYAYADREKQIQMDLQNEIKKIRESSVDDPSYYVKRAESRAAIEKELYRAQLEYEQTEFKLSEEQKLKLKLGIDQKTLALNEQLSATDLKNSANALNEKYKLEVSLSKLAKEKRIFEAEKGMYSEMEIIRKRYDFERQEIAKTVGLSDEERQRRLDASNFNQQQEENSTQFDLQKNYNQALGMDTSVDEAFKTRQEAINAYYRNNQEKQDEYQRVSLASQRAYELAKAGMNVQYGEQIVGSLADMYGSMRGEQSKGFKVLFAAEKAFAIARASIALSENIARASSIGFPQNLPLIAGAVAQGATIFANIRSVKDAGFQTGGYTGNGGVSDVAGVVHGQEYVLNAAATKRVGVDTLNAINNGSNIIAAQHASANSAMNPNQKQTIDNQLRVIMVKDEQEAIDNLYGPDGEKAFLYHMKRTGYARR